MTKERSLLSSIVSKLMLILAIAGLLVAPMPERLHADDEVTTSAPKVEETNTGFKAKLSENISKQASLVDVTSQITNSSGRSTKTPKPVTAELRAPYSNRPLAISDEFGGRSGDNTQLPASQENNFTTTATGEVPGEGNFRTLPSSRSVVVSSEFSFTTSSGPTDDNNELTFTTLSEGGGGCTENCGSGGSSGSRRRPPRDEEPPATCPLYLREFIKLGRENNPLEVLKLQEFLITFEGLSVPRSGVYDQSTYEAVKIFQTRYGRDVLGPWGIGEPTGYVFITTRLAINNIHCARTTANNLDLRNFYPELAAGRLPVDNDISKEAAGNLDDIETTVSTTTVPIDIMGETEGSDFEVVEAPIRNLLQLAALGLLDWFSDSGHILNTILLLAIIALVLWLIKLKRELESWKRSQQTPANLPVADKTELVEAPEEEGVLKNLDREDDWDNWLDDGSQPTLDKMD